MAATKIAKAKERTEAIVGSARSVFLRYGYARTTMDDLARAAGISRPALYLIFPGKEELFSAVIDDLWQETQRLYEAKLRNLRTLDDRLRFVLHHWAGTGYDLVSTHPDASDAFDIRHPSVRRMYENLCILVGDLISDAAVQSQLQVSPRELAQAAIFSLRGVKEIVRNRQHMRTLIDLQVDLLLAGLRTGCPMVVTET